MQALKKMLSALIVATGVLLTLPAVHAETAEFGIIQMDLGREFGVFTGDIIQHHYVIQVPANMTLSVASLPKPGDLDYWLELQTVDHEELLSNQFIRLYRVTLGFQTFYAPLDVRRLQIPTFQVSFNVANADNMQTVTLPAWSFTMSPLKQIAARGVGSVDDATQDFMKPDLLPKLIPVQKFRQMAYAFASMTAVFFLIWLVLQSGLFGFASSPFNRARRRLKRLQKKPALTEAEYAQALTCVHKAFNEYAGKPVFSHQIGRFVTRYPEFEPHQEQIESFFARSNQTLFGAHREAIPLVQLATLCRNLAGAEKLVGKA